MHVTFYVPKEVDGTEVERMMITTLKTIEEAVPDTVVTVDEIIVDRRYVSDYNYANKQAVQAVWYHSGDLLSDSAVQETQNKITSQFTGWSLIFKAVKAPWSANGQKV